MSNNCKKKCNKFNQGCNKKHDNDCCECSKFQEISREKCEQANCIIERANRIAQQARQAQQRAERLKQQSIEECSRANCLWEEYKRLSRQGEELMKQAKDCLEASVQCFKECHKEDCGCSINDCEWKIECKDDKHTCDHSCKCNHNWGC
ncbi:hypothetical protein ACQQ2T_04415 [Paraclostridium tenue]